MQHALHAVFDEWFQGFGSQAVYDTSTARVIGRDHFPRLSAGGKTNTKKPTNIMQSILNNIMLAAFAAGLASLASAAPLGKGTLEATNQPTAQQYTCPMHPEVVKAAPGNCPKCGMKLVAKHAAKH